MSKFDAIKKLFGLDDEDEDQASKLPEGIMHQAGDTVEEKSIEEEAMEKAKEAEYKKNAPFNYPEGTEEEDKPAYDERRKALMNFKKTGRFR
jgi:hypothetical protein